MMAACIERHPTSWLFAINRFPLRIARPCVSPTVKIGLFAVVILGRTIHQLFMRIKVVMNLFKGVYFLQAGPPILS
jgi:hypothetical protein